MPAPVPGPTQHKQLLGSWFSVEITGGPSGEFTDAGGLSIEIEVVKEEGSNSDVAQRVRPGRAKYQDITLKRKLSADKGFWTWMKTIRDNGADFRKDGSIVFHDITGTEVSRWTFTNSWPSKWSASDPDIGSDDPITEEITLTIEQLKRSS